jgi:hypothetical protein
MTTAAWRSGRGLITIMYPQREPMSLRGVKPTRS